MRKRLNISLDELLYEKIKTLATNDHRSVSNKIECMLEEYVNRPGMYSTPAQSPLYYPPGVRSPIPEPPYKVTFDTNSTRSPKTTFDPTIQKGPILQSAPITAPS